MEFTEKQNTTINISVSNILTSMEAKEWQNKIVESIRAIASTSEKEIPSDCIYWLLELYNMFGEMDKAGM